MRRTVLGQPALRDVVMRAEWLFGRRNRLADSIFKLECVPTAAKGNTAFMLFLFEYAYDGMLDGELKANVLGSC